MRRRVRTFTGLLLASALTVLSACSGSSSATKGPVQLVVWHQESPPNRVQQWQKIIDRFNSSQSRVHVIQQVKDWNTIYTVAPAAITSRRGPDVLMVMPELSTYIRLTGAAQPVTSLVKELDSKYHYISAATDPYFDQNEYWGVPLWGMVQLLWLVQLLWYRKGEFRKAGIANAPATWEEMLADARKLTSGSQYGITLPGSKTTATDQTFFVTSCSITLTRSGHSTCTAS
jgi:multiple sugar transport system substrate-binding protein